MSAQPSQTGPRAAAPPPDRRPHLRVLPIPATDPAPLSPEELAMALSAPARSRPSYRQEALSVSFDQEGDALFRPQPTPASRLPEPSLWAEQALRLLLEVMDGLRPARQLSRWVDHGIAERVARRGIVARRRGGRYPQPGRVCSVHLSTPRDDACEVAALVVHAGRYRAVALRMTGMDGRWVLTALEVG